MNRPSHAYLTSGPLVSFRATRRPLNIKRITPTFKKIMLMTPKGNTIMTHRNQYTNSKVIERKHKPRIHIYAPTRNPSRHTTTQNKSSKFKDTQESTTFYNMVLNGINADRLTQCTKTNRNNNNGNINSAHINSAQICGKSKRRTLKTPKTGKECGKR